MMRRFFQSLWTSRLAEPFAFLRAGLGLATFLEFLAYAPHLLEYFSDQGLFPQGDMANLGPSPGPLYLMAFSDSPGWVISCYVTLLLSSLLFAVGIRTRLFGPLLWFLQMSFVNRNAWAVSGVPILSNQLLLIVVWFDLGGALGPESRHTKEGPPRWAGLLIDLQMAVLYFKSGFYKLMGKAWVGGDALKFMLANPDWRRFDYDPLLAHDWVLKICQVMDWVTVAWELTFPLLLLCRRTRVVALLLGLFIHSGQFLTVSTGAFPLLLLSVYPCLLGDQEYLGLKDRLTRLFQPRKDVQV